MKQNNIVFAFSSAIKPGNKEMGKHIEDHGDGVKDIAFTVDDATAIYDAAVKNGATSVLKPTVYEDEKEGKVILASVKTYGDTIHTFVERKDYKGHFLPGFKDTTSNVDPFTKFT